MTKTDRKLRKPVADRTHALDIIRVDIYVLGSMQSGNSKATRNIPISMLGKETDLSPIDINTERGMLCQEIETDFNNQAMIPTVEYMQYW